MRSARPLCVALFLLGMTTHVARAQSSASPLAQQRGRIVGVFDEETREPIPGAEVIDLFTGASGRTESHGLVELSHFTERNDSAVVRVRKLGFADTSLIVLVGRADTVPVEIDLHPAVIDLPAIISHAVLTPSLEARGLTEYEDRKKMGFGYFIDGPELRKYVDDRVFTDYLGSHFPGMTVYKNYVSSTEGGCAGAALRCGGGGCPPALYVDGVPTFIPGVAGGMPDLRNVNSADFVGIEWYSSGATVPTEYGGTGTQCGVLLLWRRH